MEWIKLDFDNLPEGELLCGNFKGGTYGYGEKEIGRIHKYSNTYHCVGEGSSVSGITHYIDIHKFDPKSP
jgi:hypothetical protein